MKAKFTGHDTFPLRYGWLFKSINHMNNNGKFQTSNEEHTRRAIVELGVGKNMVNAIRYWAESSAVITPSNVGGFIEHTVSDEGRFLFGDNDKNSGADPYLEDLGSIWFIHFLLNFNFEALTAYRYFFSFSNTQSFEKKKLLDDFMDDSIHITGSNSSNISTLKKDLDCFLNTYAKKRKASSSKKIVKIDEDHFSSPLTELNLINETGNGFYISELAERPSLPIEIFIYALLKFIKTENEDSGINTIDFDSILSKPFSPGRIFRLSEAGLGHKLDDAQDITGGSIQWIDSLGLRQIRIDRTLMTDPFEFIKSYYGDKNAA
jgi:hypothetical protein